MQEAYKAGNVRKPGAPAQSNQFAVAARLTKAFNLAVFLHRAGVSAAAAQTMTAADWQLAARGAGTQPPSEETQRIAIAKLAALEAPVEDIERIWDRVAV